MIKERSKQNKKNVGLYVYAKIWFTKNRDLSNSLITRNFKMTDRFHELFDERLVL